MGILSKLIGNFHVHCATLQQKNHMFNMSEFGKKLLQHESQEQSVLVSKFRAVWQTTLGWRRQGFWGLAVMVKWCFRKCKHSVRFPFLDNSLAQQVETFGVTKLYQCLYFRDLNWSKKCLCLFGVPSMSQISHCCPFKTHQPIVDESNFLGEKHYIFNQRNHLSTEVMVDNSCHPLLIAPPLSADSLLIIIKM